MAFALEDQEFALEEEKKPPLRVELIKALPRPINPFGSVGEAGVINAISFLPRAAYATVAGAIQLLADTAQGKEDPKQYFSENFNSAMDKLHIPEDEKAQFVTEILTYPFVKAHEAGEKAAEHVFEEGLPGTGGLAKGSVSAATGLSIAGDTAAMLVASVVGRRLIKKKAPEEKPIERPVETPPEVAPEVQLERVPERRVDLETREAWNKHQRVTQEAWDEYQKVVESETASQAEKVIARDKYRDISAEAFAEYERSPQSARGQLERSPKTPTERVVEPVENIPIEQARVMEVPPAVSFTEPLFKLEVAPKITGNIATLAKEFFEQNPGERNSRLLVSDDIVRQGLAGKIPKEMLEKHGLSAEEFQGIWRKTVSDAASTLARLSQIDRKLKLTPEEAAILRKHGLEIDDATVIQPLWKRIDNVRRGLLVTQLATAARNGITQAGRLGLDVLQAPIDAGIQRLTGRPHTVSPLDGLEQFIQLFKKNKDAVEKVFEHHPSARQRMLTTYMSDIAAADKSASGKVMSGVERAVDILNWANKGQEFIIRRAVFQANLSQAMRRNGLNLEEMIKKNEFDRIPQAEVELAVTKALEATFAATPEMGTARRAFIDLINKTPGATLIVPFPRFMTNAMKYLWEYNPTGFLNYLSAKERAAFAKGDTSTMSKAIIGSGLLTAAFAFRDSEYAGEKWYEARTPDGKIIDLRPFNPFATYLFIADVAKRSKEGNLHTFTSKDIASGVLSTQLRAGTGLYVLDETLKSLSADSYSPSKWDKRVAEFSGEISGGFLTPLATVRDLYSEFDENSRKLRDTRQEPFLGPIKRQIPGLSATLPEAEIPTRAGPIEIINPGLRQFTGISQSGPKNQIEKELDRLGFARYEVLKSTGDAKLDSQYAKVMGPIIERAGDKLVTSNTYKNLSDAQKSVVLQHVVADIRSKVKDAVNLTLSPEEQVKRKLEHEPGRTKRMLREAGVRIE